MQFSVLYIEFHVGCVRARSTEQVYRNSKWQAERGCGNHVCYSTDCYGLSTKKISSVTKIYSNEVKIEESSI